MGFVDVVLFVHDDHDNPLVCCENHPGVVLFEFSKGSALGRGLRLHCLLCCCYSCLSILLTSDLSSSASWDGNLLAACSVEVMYASMVGYLGVMA